MSERSSFVTEYIYCHNCFAAIRQHLGGSRDKYLCTTQIPTWDPLERIPIIAGKIGGLGPGDDLLLMLGKANEISRNLCHPVKIALILDSSGFKPLIILPCGEGYELPSEEL